MEILPLNCVPARNKEILAPIKPIRWMRGTWKNAHTSRRLHSCSARVSKQANAYCDIQKQGGWMASCYAKRNTATGWWCCHISRLASFILISTIRVLKKIPSCELATFFTSHLSGNRVLKFVACLWKSRRFGSSSFVFRRIDFISNWNIWFYRKYMNTERYGHYYIKRRVSVRNIKVCWFISWGVRWCSLLRHCTTSRKVTCSIPDEGINHSGRTMALGSTHSSFIQSVFCLTTGPKPPPKRCLHIVRSRASSF